MASSSVLVELLRFLAANEELPRTAKRYPGYDRDTLGKLINAAAERIEQMDRAAEEASKVKKKSAMKVRKVSEVERAAQESARALEEEMELSKAERERRKKERAAAEAERIEAERVEQDRVERTRLFCDGAARGNPGPAGAGAVIINPAGHIVAKIGKFLGDNTNNFAEYMGLLLGLKRARAMGIRDLEVLSDSELLIRQLEGRYQVKAENLRPLHDEAKQLLGGFDTVLLRHIPREENGQADEMSNRAIDERL